MTSIRGNAEPRPVTDADLAELAQVAGLPMLVERYTALVLDDAAEARQTLADVKDVLQVLDQVKAPDDMPKSTKHDAECWRKHVPCLAEKIRDALPDLD